MRRQVSKQNVLTNLIWRFAERCGAQLVAFIISVILARLLDPDVYGTVALITVFTAVLQVFVDSGLGNALIQKKEADNIDFSTVFFTNIIFCTILYIGMYFFAPSIATFYGDMEMIPLIRVLSITVLISGVKNVQQAYVSRNLLFKRFFFSTLGGTIVAAIVGIIMAYSGFGVWALVVQQVLNLAVDTIILWITVKWKPQLTFSFKRLKSLYAYGWKLLASSLLDTIYNNVRQLIIGKLYTSESLAFYNRGKQFPNLIVTNINTSIDSVLFPTMSNCQDDSERIKNMTRRSIKISIYIMAPLMMGLCFVADPFIRLLLTDKWLLCVPFLRIFCITFMFYPIHTANLNAIKAMGKSDLFLKLEILKKIVGIVLLVVTMWHGVMAMAYSTFVSSFLSQIINTWPNRKLLNYSYFEQLKDIAPSIFLAIFMGVCVLPMGFVDLPAVIILVIQVILGICIYVTGSVVLKIDSFFYLWDMIKQILQQKREK